MSKVYVCYEHLDDNCSDAGYLDMNVPFIKLIKVVGDEILAENWVELGNNNKNRYREFKLETREER